DDRRGVGGALPEAAPPGVEVVGGQAVSGTEDPRAQAARPPLGDPASPLPFLLLVPRSARGHGCALLSEGFDHGRQEREPPDGDPPSATAGCPRRTKSASAPG